MGELLDALNAADAGIARGEPAEKSAAERAADAIQSVSQRADSAIEAGRKPGMPPDMLSRLVRQAPLQSLAIAFLVGAILFRRR
ncbi:hypothetical protein [Bradyrhizobium canariense]|uniref:Uncharacterized protein n=1 Tax=Bradyrhizobium canariense TaxID=255045 RepID=A0A1H1UX12_9BRAD|nr:hypothetical protein [Bradyrhizobium canariense]SDS77035.1 hypothetical protein SAMN05444158_3142 [Bradyrhizobium canariense]